MDDIKHWLVPVLSSVLLSMTAATPMDAQDWNKGPLVTAPTLLKVPGGALPGSHYTLRFLDSNSNQQIVKIYHQMPDLLAPLRETVPEFRNRFPAQESFRFEEPISPNPPAVKGLQMGQGYFYLTRDHQRFFVPVEQPPTSLQEWHDKVTQR
jgi:hypothetical protein